MPASTDPATDTRWAPWWRYVLVLAVANAVAQTTLLGSTGPVLNALASIVLNVVLFIGVTLWWRRRHRAGPRR
ncbi:MULTISPECIES: hypothetical protein [Pseudonocardia]|uniref:Uncharacterized protein n=2 Tax=Pseudonocardia TaxID=1847 RepID=A0A1Y2N322_PSEAH|nr:MULTISPECIES: hypothetical protein [Pseudonocardia]OSY41559.1 hypothetical protein BG845_02050 [Pseudonocardia autotrophica]TDN71514.1 hypothetical protein C8E95_0546 [Pseudonocardia autotrophica]BBG02193.1 hypothetical protein Pdca_34020 [Pseudonocardia autotrophica]GEC24207.1 hypothetical protein PSA01_12360 [Pseudonocardia saturnea]